MKVCMVWIYEMWSYPYMHYVGQNDYMMKVLYYMNEVAFTYLLRYELNVKICDFMKGLLRMYGFMWLHIFISLVNKDWYHEQGLIMMDVKRSNNMYNLK